MKPMAIIIIADLGMLAIDSKITTQKITIIK